MGAGQIGPGTGAVHLRPHGSGAVALFDVDSNETLHRLLTEWADMVPAEFDLYPLIDPDVAVAYLNDDSAV